MQATFILRRHSLIHVTTATLLFGFGTAGCPEFRMKLFQ
jgi:hypothetical protein